MVKSLNRRKITSNVTLSIPSHGTVINSSWRLCSSCCCGSSWRCGWPSSRWPSSRCLPWCHGSLGFLNTLPLEVNVSTAPWVIWVEDEFEFVRVESDSIRTDQAFIVIVWSFSRFLNAFQAKNSLIFVKCQVRRNNDKLMRLFLAQMWGRNEYKL